MVLRLSSEEKRERADFEKEKVCLQGKESKLQRVQFPGGSLYMVLKREGGPQRHAQVAEVLLFAVDTEQNSICVGTQAHKPYIHVTESSPQQGLPVSGQYKRLCNWKYFHLQGFSRPFSTAVLLLRPRLRVVLFMDIDESNSSTLFVVQARAPLAFCLCGRRTGRTSDRIRRHCYSVWLETAWQPSSRVLLPKRKGLPGLMLSHLSNNLTSIDDSVTVETAERSGKEKIVSKDGDKKTPPNASAKPCQTAQARAASGFHSIPPRPVRQHSSAPGLRLQMALALDHLRCANTVLRDPPRSLLRLSRPAWPPSLDTYTGD